eukprot:1494628-Pyramimonas_sp.AAC.1
MLEEENEQRPALLGGPPFEPDLPARGPGVTAHQRNTLHAWSRPKGRRRRCRRCCARTPPKTDKNDRARVTKGDPR